MSAAITKAAVEACKRCGGILLCLRHGSWWSFDGWCDEVGRRCHAANSTSPQIRAEDSLWLITSEWLSLHIQSSFLFPFYCACILVVNEPECKLWVKWSRLKMCISFNFGRFFFCLFPFIAGKLKGFYEFIMQKNLKWHNYVFFHSLWASANRQWCNAYLSVFSFRSHLLTTGAFWFYSDHHILSGFITSGLEWCNILERCHSDVHLPI